MQLTRVLATATATVALAAVAALTSLAAIPNGGQPQAGWGAWPSSAQHGTTAAAPQRHADDSVWG